MPRRAHDDFQVSACRAVHRHAAHEPAANERKTILDPAPRVILDQELGLCCVGKSAKDAAVVHDIYEHTMECILRAEKLGGWKALPAEDLFDVEYWDLEQAKLAKGGTPPLFSGEAALVTGAASGIGKACVESFLQRGIAVVGLDIDERITAVSTEPGFLGIQCDLTDESQIQNALDAAVSRFGGVDMLVLNAGMFPASTRIGELSLDAWRTVMAVNLDANLVLLRECYSLLKHAPGRRMYRLPARGPERIPLPRRP